MPARLLLVSRRGEMFSGVLWVPAGALHHAADPKPPCQSRRLPSASCTTDTATVRVSSAATEELTCGVYHPRARRHCNSPRLGYSRYAVAGDDYRPVGYERTLCAPRRHVHDRDVREG